MDAGATSPIANVDACGLFVHLHVNFHQSFDAHAAKRTVGFGVEKMRCALDATGHMPARNERNIALVLGTNGARFVAVLRLACIS